MTEFLSEFEMNAEMDISKTSGDQQGEIGVFRRNFL